MKTRVFITLGISLILISMTGCDGSSPSAANSLSKTEEITLDEIEDNATENPDTNCSAVNPHPMAEGMSETFEITYDEVMTLYCDGYAFSDILLALETSELVDQSPAALLARLRTRTWQDIWDEFGLNQE